MKVWLDDKRVGPCGWIHLKNALDGVNFIKEHGISIEEMSFDHDLGYEGPRDGTPEDGHDVAKVLEEMAYLGKIRSDIKLSVHSSNSAGANEIRLALGSALRFLDRDRSEVLVLNYERDILPLILGANKNE